MGDVVPDGWTQKTIGEIGFDISDGNYSSKYPKSSDFVSYGIPFLRANNIENGKVTNSDVRYISQTQHDELKKGHLKLNDVLITTRGDTGQVAQVPPHFVGANINAQLVRINTGQKMNSSYLFFYMDLETTRDQLKELETGTALKQLPVGNLKQIEINYPPLPEQKKIATILTSVDTVIEKTQAQIDKLNDLKTGMMQELLTKGIGPDGKPHTEFKDSPVGRIPVGWDVMPLYEIAKLKHGYAFEGQYFKSEAGPIILMTPGNFHRDGHLYFGNNTKYYDGPYDDEYVLENDDLLVVMTDLTKEMAILGNAVILDCPSIVLHNQRIGKITDIDTKKITNQFLCLLLNSDRIKGHIKDTATGTTVRHSSPSRILESNARLPTLEEQEKIVEQVRSIDALLSQKKAKHSTYLSLKAALMQDLLTGKVRVTPEAA